MPTHHQAINAIFDLKHNAPNRDLFVAECDIRGFFDTVDHGVALAAYRRAAHDAELDIRADQIFSAYLNCYSFPLNVLAEAGPILRQTTRQDISHGLNRHYGSCSRIRAGNGSACLKAVQFPVSSPI